MTSLPQRHNFKWNVNELLSLQREYELLEMSIQDISVKHGRTVVAILYRLQQEGFIDSWIDARGYQDFSKTQSYLVGSLDCQVNPYDYEENVTQDNDNDNDSDYEEESDNEEESDYEEEQSISSLNQRVWSLETAVSDIKGMIGTLLSRFNTSSKPLKKLRQTQVSESI
jgi:ribosomal protein S8